MALVEDEQAILVAPAFEVNMRGVVGGDGERLQIVVAAAEQTNWLAEVVDHFAVPLVEQIDGRRDDEGGASGLADGEDGGVSLAGAGRQYDDAARSLLP